MATTIQNGEAQNKLGNPQGKPSYSNFPIHKHRYTTERFGINDVCGVFNGIEADQVDWRPAHELTTYTLSAPLMTPVYKEKDYILVARCAILPKNWDKIHVQPNIGEDIDATTIGTSIPGDIWTNAMNLPIGWLYSIKQSIEEWENDYEEEIPGDVICETVEQILYSLTTAEYFFSYGSLLSKMGAKFATLYTSTIWKEPYDLAFDRAISELKKSYMAFDVIKGNDEFIVNIVDEPGAEKPTNTIELREFLDMVRENPSGFSIRRIAKTGSDYNFTIDAETKDGVEQGDFTIDGLKNLIDTVTATGIAYEKPVDLARLWAYQLANAEYFTNSHVDYIFSAELYRQYVYNLVKTMTNFSETGETFSWNGVEYEYDYLSEHYFLKAMNSGTSKEIAEYFAAIFSFRRSLKYLDYFTGAKTKPLATGDVTINPGLGGAINVIDVTRKGQAYKFLNAVNRIGRKAEDYAQEIMGVKQRHDFHNPLWLGSTRTAVRGEITDNTGAAQVEEANAQTARLYGVDGKYKFNFELDRDSIIVGITFYDIERSYFKGVHRSFMHVDRYDMYNPYLQYTGDQEIYGEEYAANKNGNPFGYTPAYEEFKQEYNTADAGFVVALPGYTFLDGLYNNNREGGEPNSSNNIGPNFIRSKSVEFDRFYNSLTGYSLGTYFHFILDYYNELEAKRKMAFNPGVAL